MANIRKTGLSDEVQVNDGSDTDVFSNVDVNIASASHNVELPDNLFSSVGEGAGYVARTDGVISIEGDLSIRAIDSSVLRLIGNYSEDTDAGTWSISSQDVLPAWDFKQQITENEYISLGGYTESGGSPSYETGFKFDEVTINVATDEPITMDFSGLGLFAQVESGTIDTNNSSLNPENWLDAHVQIDGTSVASLEDAEISITRDAEAVRGIQDKVDSTRVLPDEIVEGMRDVSVSMTVEVTDREPWEDVFGDTSTPLQPSGDKTPVPVTLVLSNGDEISLSDVVFTSIDGELADDAEVRTVSLEGTALDWSASGDL